MRLSRNASDISSILMYEAVRAAEDMRIQRLLSECIMEKYKADVTICGNDYQDKNEDKVEIAKYVNDELRHTSKVLNSNQITEVQF